MQRYRVYLETINAEMEVVADDFEIDAEEKSIVFFNYVEGEDNDISVAYFPLDKVMFVNVKESR